MKKSLIAFSVLGMLAASPAAALPPPPPAVDPACFWWCGLYVGLNAGGAWGYEKASFSGNPTTAPDFAANEFPTTLSLNPSGFIGGAQIGYNWLVAPRFLVGVEADFDGSGYRGSATAAPTPTIPFFVPFTTSVEEHSNWFGTIGPRVGFLVLPNLLAFGTGGLAYGQVETSFSTVETGFTLATCPAFRSCASGSSSSVRAGWFAGAGLEWMFLPHWSLSAEYLFVDFDPSATGTSMCCGTFTANTPFRENIARAGVNWYFEPPVAPPVVTK